MGDVTPDELFKRHGDTVIRLQSWDVRWHITVEDLYQAFKARLLEEMAEEKSDEVL